MCTLNFSFMCVAITVPIVTSHPTLRRRLSYRRQSYLPRSHRRHQIRGRRLRHLQ